MEVKRIVVDELPSTCRMCKFQSVRPVKNGLRMYCSLKDKMVHNLRVCPSWCPLEVEEVCEWVLENTDRGYAAFYIPKDHEQHPDCYTQDAGNYDYCPTCGKLIKYVEVE